MRRNTSESGVTLMEMLISVVLLSFLSVGILFAMRVGLQSMDKANTHLMSNRRVVGSQRVLEQQIRGLMLVTAECSQGPGMPMSARIPFFQGRPQLMRLVSNYSLEEASRGTPRILEFMVIPGVENKGVRLVVNEYPYSGPRSTGSFCLGVGPDPMTGFVGPIFRPAEPSPRSFVLADKLAYCRFVYRETMLLPLPDRWLPQWIKQELPSAIRVEMAPLDGGPASLHVMSVTLPVRIDKDPTRIYAD
jgi:hypothetical protein